MKVTRILSVLVAVASIGNHMYAADGSVMRSDIQGRENIASALEMVSHS